MGINQQTTELSIIVVVESATGTDKKVSLDKRSNDISYLPRRWIAAVGVVACCYSWQIFGTSRTRWNWSFPRRVGDESYDDTKIRKPDERLLLSCLHLGLDSISHVQQQSARNQEKRIHQFSAASTVNVELSLREQGLFLLLLSFYQRQPDGDDISTMM